MHRDVKPANILFTANGEPVLTDFGISKLLGESAQISASGSVIGSPAYMSPEQAASKPVDPRSDRYSLGIVLYEMATGRVPFQGDSPTAVLLQHLNDPPPPPRQFNAEHTGASSRRDPESTRQKSIGAFCKYRRIGAHAGCGFARRRTCRQKCCLDRRADRPGATIRCAWGASFRARAATPSSHADETNIPSTVHEAGIPCGARETNTQSFKSADVSCSWRGHCRAGRRVCHHQRVRAFKISVNYYLIAPTYEHCASHPHAFARDCNSNAHFANEHPSAGDADCDAASISATVPDCRT